MHSRPDTIARRVRRAALVTAAASGLAVVMTWPLARGLGSLGRSTGGGDGLYGVWNVAWVAHALTSNPARLYDANIFYPHRLTLAFSEANIGAGIVAIPAWLATHNPYAAHNLAVLVAFATGVIGMWLLARYLSGDARTAWVAGMLFAFCPYLMTHTAHIQLLMCGGLPLAMWLTHRLADAPSSRRGVLLGAALAAQALSCAYYGIFAGLMAGYAVLFLAWARGLWRSLAWWRGVAIAAAVAVLPVLPFFLPYLSIQQDQGFRRTIEDAARYSANAQSYVASPAHAHAWLLTVTAGWPRWSEPLFPGFLAIILGLAGLLLHARRPRGHAPAPPREAALLYGSLGLLAFWASFGPAAGLYALLFRLPLFSFLRAPSRFGLVVTLSLAALASLALPRLLRRVPPPGRTAAAAALMVLAVAELNVLPFPWERAQRIPEPYTQLATLPRGPVAEFPYYGERPVYHLHTQYMLFSTAHWFPLLNGYSDHIPQDFRDTAGPLSTFPSDEAFAVMRHARVRYIGVHWDMFGPKAQGVRERLQRYLPYLRPVAEDGTMTLYRGAGVPLRVSGWSRTSSRRRPGPSSRRAPRAARRACGSPRRCRGSASRSSAFQETGCRR